jgi:carboxyl-terminal processing protease
MKRSAAQLKISLPVVLIVLLSFSILFSEKSFSDEKSRFEKLELFNKVLYLIETQYYRDVDTDKLIKGAIKGMMDALDPHSAFLDKDVFDKIKEDTKGEFGGLGIEVTQKDGVIVVITPIEDTPAFKAGVKPGDRIVEINHESIVGFSLDAAVDKMKGKPGTTITLGISRSGEDGVRRIKIKREVIKTKPIKLDIIEDNFIYIRLTQFQQRASKEIINGIKKLKKKLESKKIPIEGIILDLRSNPGGLLTEAVKVSSIFLKEGVVVSTEGRGGKDKEIRYVEKNGFKELTIPLAVLINGASASASEIVAGALQDYGRAIVVGNQSFGKGSVQTVSKIDDENGVKLTVAQYMTPKGRKIQALGIKPDIVLDNYEVDKLRKYELDEKFVRERDLRNHLTATVETKEEKKVREELEKEERKKRIKEMEIKKQERKKEENGSVFRKFNPKKDYQVIQAAHYLKSYKIFEKIRAN